nr:MAG TPA: hypothetical protein [Caudoviricetes sp.]
MYNCNKKIFPISETSCNISLVVTQVRFLKPQSFIDKH